MEISSILSVALGLIFVWLVLSLAVMNIQEWIAAKLQWRSKMLETTIRNLLADPGLTDQFYNHPLIRSLFSGNDGSTKPSYIPASQFTLTLFDIVATAGTEASLLQQQLYKLRLEVSLLGRNQRKAAQRRLNLILALTRRALVSDPGQTAVVNATLDSIRSEINRFGVDYPKLKASVDGSLLSVKVQKEQIDSIINALPKSEVTPESANDKVRMGVAAMSVTHPRLKQILSALITGADESPWQGENSFVHSRENVEKWFDNSMDRLNGWYKRRAQILAFTIGFLIASITNVDTILVANQLWRQPVLRDKLSAQAEIFVIRNQDQVEPVSSSQLALTTAEVNAISLPIGWIGKPQPLNSKGLVTGSDNKTSVCAMVPLKGDDLYGIPLAGQCFPITNAPIIYDLSGWFQKILGLLITGLAAAQGAPFWFDILKKIINVRSAGLNPSELPKAVG
jgi:hypothetical protein